MADVTLWVVTNKGPRRHVLDGDFGEGDVRWASDRQSDPAQVAAAWIQHRLVRELRRRYGPRRLSAAALADATGARERSVARLLSGETMLGLDDVVALAGAAGFSLLELLPRDLTDFLPPGLPTLDPEWQPGSWKPPRFVPAAERIGSLDWQAITRELARFVEDEAAAQRLRLVTPAVLRHQIIVTLERHGVVSGVAGLDGDATAVFDLASTAAVACSAEVESSASVSHQRQATRRIIATLHSAAAFDADERYAVLVMTDATAARLDALTRDSDHSLDALTLSFSVLHSLFDGDNDHIMPESARDTDVSGRSLSDLRAAGCRLLVLELDKPQVR